MRYKIKTVGELLDLLSNLPRSTSLISCDELEENMFTRELNIKKLDANNPVYLEELEAVNKCVTHKVSYREPLLIVMKSSSSKQNLTAAIQQRIYEITALMGIAPRSIRDSLNKTVQVNWSLDSGSYMWISNTSYIECYTGNDDIRNIDINDLQRHLKQTSKRW